MELKEALVELVLLKSKGSYRSSLRAAARGYWSEELSLFGFVDAMVSAIEREFPRAWAEGAGRCGIKLDELTDAEKTRLAQEVANDMRHITDFAEFIYDNRRGVGKLETVFNRVAFWVEGYDRVANTAEVMACGDQKMIWTLHPAEHCSSCKRLDGKVKRASYWSEHNVFPKSWDKLKCKQNCKCTLEKTTLPLSKGPLPVLP